MTRSPMPSKFKQRKIGIQISYLNPENCISGFCFSTKRYREFNLLNLAENEYFCRIG
jgi:hypothetical protein